MFRGYVSVATFTYWFARTFTKNSCTNSTPCAPLWKRRRIAPRHPPIMLKHSFSKSWLSRRFNKFFRPLPLASGSLFCANFGDGTRAIWLCVPHFLNPQSANWRMTRLPDLLTRWFKEFLRHLNCRTLQVIRCSRRTSHQREAPELSLMYDFPV